jgi:hypothetical protein
MAANAITGQFKIGLTAEQLGHLDTESRQALIELAAAAVRLESSLLYTQCVKDANEMALTNGQRLIAVSTDMKRQAIAMTALQWLNANGYDIVDDDAQETGHRVVRKEPADDAN